MVCKPYKANGTRTNLGRASGMISLTGYKSIRPPENIFLGDTDPRSGPMLGASRAGLKRTLPASVPRPSSSTKVSGREILDRC
jgi:hypothetical protein